MSLQAVAIEVARWLTGAGTWPQSPPPPALPPVFNKLQRVLDNVLNDPSLKDLGVVLLNFGPVDKQYKTPTCACKNETAQWAIGSASKLAIMYAAFQLKADVETVANEVARKIAPAPPKLADLQERLAEYW